LAVGLACDGAVAAVRAADAPGSEDDVDGREDVFDAVAVVLEAAGVEEEAGPGGTPPLGRFSDGLLGNARDFRSAAGRPGFYALGNLVEADGMVLDEVMVEPVVLDHQVEDAVEQGGIAARLDRQEEIAGAGDGGQARIDDDYFGAVLT